MTFETTNLHGKVLQFNPKSITLSILEKDSHHVLKVYLFPDLSIYIVTPYYGIQPKEMAELGYIINSERKELTEAIYSRLYKNVIQAQ